MAAALQSALGQIRRRLGTPAEPTDRDLLDRFAAGDDSAFAGLVQRHGGMVLGVCRRVLRHEADAEDAFQATFLALARKARQAGWRDSVAGWLHAVAWRSAVKLRARSALRRAHERRAGAPPAAGPAVELHGLLDEEVRRLPEPCREAVVRCYFQGQTRDQAARQLGWSLRTLERRLEQGRQRLRQRLQRHDLTPALLLAAGPGTVPPALASAALHAAGSLRGAVSRWLARAAILVASLAGAAGLSLAARPAAAPPPAPPPAPPAAVAAPRAAPAANEAPLPDRALARLGSTRFRHGFAVNCVAFGPGGKVLASGGGGRSLCLWEPRTGRLIRHCSAQRIGSVYGLGFSPDGRRVVCADGSLRLWDAATGDLLHEFKGHTNGVVAAAYAPDGKLIASGSHDNTVRLWDPDTGRPVRVLEGHDKSIWGLAFRPDGQVLASGDLGGVVRLWEPATGKLLHLCKGHTKGVLTLAFAARGHLLASCGEDGTARLWDSDTGRLLHTLTTGERETRGLAFAPDARAVAVGCVDGTIRLFRTDTGKELRRWHAHAFRLQGLAWSADGKVLASGAVWESTVRRWDPETGKEIDPTPGHTGPVDQLRYSADGTTLFSSGRDRRLLRWDLATGRSVELLRGAAPASLDSIAIGPGGARAAVGTWRQDGGPIRVYDLATGKQAGTAGRHAGRISSVVFSPDGRRVASLADDDTLLLHDLAGQADVWTVRLGRRAQDRGRFFQPLLFSPDGRTVAFGGQDGLVRLHDAATGKEARRLTLGLPVGGAAFSPDSRLVAAAGGYRAPVIVVWDARTGAVRRSWQNTQTGTYNVAFSPDGRLLATGGDDGDDTVVLWEVATGRPVASFVGHHSAVLPLAFAPDGRSLASGGGDSAVLVWDLTGRKGKQAARLAPARLAALWDALAGDDAARAHAALWELAAAPQQAVPFLAGKLPVARAPDAKEVARLIARLDAEDYATRAAAAEKLAAMGLAAEALVREALAAKPALEPRQRLERLLGRWLSSADWVRYRRAVAALEHAGTPPARAVLAALAAGAPGASSTEEAKRALKRLRP